MNISIEVSLYPLADEFIPPIQDFIDRLNRHPELTVLTNTMSTQVFGDYETVWRVLGEEMATTHERVPKAAFAMKVLGSDLRPS